VASRQTVSIKYNVITRQYHVNVMGSVQQSFATLDEALFLIRRPSRWLIAPKGALKPGETYNVTLRIPRVPAKAAAGQRLQQFRLAPRFQQEDLHLQGGVTG
jgi:hypothetical protein